MADQFSLSDEIVEDDASEAFRKDVPIDPEAPGLASLLVMMKAAREGQVERAVQVAYFQKLKALAEQAQASLAATVVPEEIAASVGPALAATRGIVGDMQEVVNLFGDWMATGHVEYLDRAVAMLEAIHAEIRKATQSRTPAAAE